MSEILNSGGYIMKIIAVGTLKGGTGKTTVTFNLAGILALEKKVLLIDVDPQCNLSNNIGVDITDQGIWTVKDIFEGYKSDPANLIIKQPIERLPNLDVIASSIGLVATELKIGGRTARERILSNYIDDNRSFFEQYDYILIDTNPSMGMINQNAFLAADSIILVTDADDNSRLGLELFMSLWDAIRTDLRKEDNIKAVIINNVDVRNNMTGEMFAYCEADEDLSKILVGSMIRKRVIFPKAARARIPISIVEQRGAGKAFTDLYDVCEELYERGVF